MQVSCPRCTQRLRYPDHLTNPLLRCRTCSTMFRPAEVTAGAQELVTAEAVEEYSFERKEAAREYRAEPPVPVVRPAPKSAPSKSAAGTGYIAIILLILAFKAGPRLLREVFREPKAPPPPARLRQDEEQALRRMLDEAAKNAENARGQRQVPIRRIPNPHVP